MELDPAKLKYQDRYKLLIGLVTPRPIAFVSTCDAEGRPNLAPYSFFTAVGSNPMLLMFCPANKEDGSEKDSLRNAKPAGEGGVGEFVVNVASESFITQVAAAGEELAFGQSEFELTGLTPTPSSVVKPPRVLESPASFECRTVRIVRTNPGEAGGGNIVLGEVVRVHARDGLLNDRLHTDAGGLASVGRMGGASYCLTRDRFDLPRGKAALDLGGA
ncbi:MAG: flavin reductase family protein [Phycisphaerales bacterium]|nr:MAG: flavin reductase family protein [Phycisphaerales bacterium]